MLRRRLARVRLTYFDINGLGEPIRLALVLADMSFTDERLTREQFADVKSQLRFGQVPCLTVNGDEYFQSSAILRYIGRAFDSSGSLYPSGNLAVAATIDALLDACTDMVTFRQAQGVSLHTTESPPPPLLSPSVHTSLLPLSPPSTIRGSSRSPTPPPTPYPSSR